MSSYYRLGLALLAGLGLAALVFVILPGAQAQPEQPETAIVVNTLEDENNNDGDCSLREAISAANSNTAVDACPAGDGVNTDTITFSVTGTIHITSQLEGFGGGPLEIDGGGSIVIDAGGHSRIIYLESGMTLTLKNLSLVHGRVVNNPPPPPPWTQENGEVDGNPITQTLESTDNNLSPNINTEACFLLSSWCAEGGAILNNGRLQIYNCTISHNTISGYTAYGAGISSFTGSLTIKDSTISDNKAYRVCYRGYCGAARGGGIYGRGTIINDTIYNNFAENSGGGVYASGSLIINSTISGNRTNHIGGGIYGGGALIKNSTIYNNGYGGIGGSHRLINTIIAGSSYANCSTQITDLGHNLDSGNTCGLDPALGSLPNTNPRLGPLQDNGGPTMTHALVGSPALDAGDNADCPETDQRGIARPIDGDLDGDAICDIGSFEVVPQGHAMATSTTITVDDPDPSLVGLPITIIFEVTTATRSPWGTVTVTTDPGEFNCSGELIWGRGSCMLTISSPGSYVLIAHYVGNDTFLPSTDTDSHSVFGARTVTDLVSDEPDPTLPGQPFTTTFAVTSTLGFPTGVVTVTAEGSAASCSATINEGTGGCVLSLFDQGTYTLTAAYSGNGFFGPSSDIDFHEVTRATTTTALVSDDPDPSLPGEPFTTTFTVTSPFGTPTGMVEVRIKGVEQTCIGDLVAGTGSCSLVLVDHGEYMLLASFSGDDFFSGSTAEGRHTVSANRTYLPMMVR